LVEETNLEENEWMLRERRIFPVLPIMKMYRVSTEGDINAGIIARPVIEFKQGLISQM